MLPLLSILARVWRAPGIWPIHVVALGAAWVGVRLADESLGGSDGFVSEVRTGSMLFAGLLVLSLAEPLEVGRDARGGMLLLRAARGRGFALVRRWLALVIATLPTVALVAVVTGGLPDQPLALLVELAVLAAAGLLLGAFFDRGLLVPALWVLLVSTHLRPWLAASGAAPVAWLLPDVTGGTGSALLLHGALWSAGALCVAHWRLSSLAGRAA